LPEAIAMIARSRRSAVIAIFVSTTPCTPIMAART
jgi:hypothetical protein